MNASQVTSPVAVRGAHLVGSINQPTAQDTFRVVSAHLGQNAARIPDGEVGERFHWILFQGSAFDRTPGLARPPIDPIELAGFDLRPLHLDGTVPTDDLVIGDLGYAGAAASSYAEFLRLREEGVIAAGTRFQVSLPSPLAPVSTFIVPEDRPAVYRAYQQAILREIAQIARQIPAEDLAIQLDLAVEFAYIEDVAVAGQSFDPWFADAGSTAPGAAHAPDADAVAAGCVQLVAPVADTVPLGAQLGFHLCYGDVAETHFVEPDDTAHLVAVANGLAASVTRPIDWVHLPVPIGRDDAAYFAPLQKLDLQPDTTLYLGLVHHEDGVEGALRRVEAAREAIVASGLTSFGVATECGFGRGPAERTAPLLDLHAEIIAAAAR